MKVKRVETLCPFCGGYVRFDFEPIGQEHEPIGVYHTRDRRCEVWDANDADGFIRRAAEVGRKMRIAAGGAN